MNSQQRVRLHKAFKAKPRGSRHPFEMVTAKPRLEIIGTLAAIFVFSVAIVALLLALGGTPR